MMKSRLKRAGEPYGLRVEFDPTRMEIAVAC